jgi:TRAP-type transport system small permease protein
MNQVIGGVCVFLFMGMLAVAFMQAALRYLFDFGFSWTEELARYLQIWLVFLGAALVFGKLGHVNINLFVHRLSPAGRLVAGLVAQGITFLFLGLLVYKGFFLVQFSWGTASIALEAPTSLVYAAVPVCAVFMGINIVHIMMGQFRGQPAGEKND